MLAALAGPALLLGLLGQGDLRELQAKLGSAEAPDRRAAVQELAKLGEEKAWRLVVDALADESSMVADEAQLVLGDLTDADVAEDLCRRDGLASRDARVRLRAAEIVGRLTRVELDPGDLAKGLKAKEAETRRVLLWSLERHPVAARLGEKSFQKLAKAVQAAMDKDKDPEVRAAAVGVRVAADPAEALLLAPQAVLDEEPLVRSAGVSFAARLPKEIARPVVHTGLGDEHHAVRTQAAEVCVGMGDRWAVGELVAALEKEKEELLTWHLVEGLRRLSGYRHGRDPRPWKEWLESLPENWATVGVKDPESVRDGPTTEARFAGLPIRSKRVVFLFDFSGSLWQEREGGRTRKQALDVELRKTLQALPEDTRFNLIPYTDAPFAWKKELVPATPSNVEAALDWFEKQNRSGKGDFWTALEFAMQDEEADNLVVFTDGKPSGGLRWNLGLMSSLWTERNRFRRLTLDAVLVDAEDWVEDRWQALCTNGSGRAVRVDME